MKIARFAVVSTAALALVVGGYGYAGAEANKDQVVIPAGFGEDDEAPAEEVPAVVITGGTITNSTNLDISANGGTSIADASGGSFNTAIVTDVNGGGDDVDGLGSVDVASAGNGGGATATANGGAVLVGDVNSGSNTGNAIVVGNTIGGDFDDDGDDKKVIDDGKKVIDVKPVVDDGKKVIDVQKPSGGGGGGDRGGGGGGGGADSGGGRVRALPATGVGGFDAGLMSTLAAAGAAAAAGLGLRRR